MKIFGRKLASQSNAVPTGGIFGLLLPLVGLVGFLALMDWGNAELEKYIVALGMLSTGVLLSRDLPVWRADQPKTES